MLAACGLQSQEELFAHLPADVQLKRPLNLPAGLSEYEIAAWFKRQGDRNAQGYPSFLGAGAYSHYRPVLCDVVASRGEFLTSYTPYQAEFAQGTLTTIFEFQTLLCQLTGMEVANASMYDGSTAMAESANMAARITGRSHFLVSRTVHPEYRQVLATMAHAAHQTVEEFSYDAHSGRIDIAGLQAGLSPATACVIIQTPNFFGIVEELAAVAELAHKAGALLIVVFTEPVALGLIAPPVEADIVAGELQSFAMPPSYGGPGAGVIATRDKYVRQIPGRLVGETTDADGNRAYCLTLATREQHIRREKATSNICSNQALTALMATVFLSVYGKQGLRELAGQNLSKAHYLAAGLDKVFSGPFFNECVIRPRGKTPASANAVLLGKKIIGGLELGRFYPELDGALLLCATEMVSRAAIETVKEVLA